MYHLWCLMDFPLAPLPQLSGETAGLIRWFICTFPPAVMDGTSTFPWNFIISQLQPPQPRPPALGKRRGGKAKRTYGYKREKEEEKQTNQRVTSVPHFPDKVCVCVWALRSNSIALRCRGEPNYWMCLGYGLPLLALWTILWFLHRAHRSFGALFCVYVE